MNMRPYQSLEPVLAPSILAGNHARLAESMQEIIASGCTWIHLDIMDGHFVPNLTFGPETVRCLREEAGDQLFFDVHLMLDNPQDYISAFAKSGADVISIHMEPEGICLRDTLQIIRDLNCMCGLVINPKTPAEVLKPYIAEVDLMLVMTVQPGFGGQAFRKDCVEKIAQLHRWRLEGDYRFRIEVDGGVDRDTGLLCRRAGADTLVAGSAFFKSPDRIAFREDLTVDIT